VHIWGGFGSQLHGIALQMFLESQLQRRCKLVFHTSGITERLCEVQKLLNKTTWVQVLDYDKFKRKGRQKSRSISSKIKSQILKAARLIVKESLRKSRVTLFPTNFEDLISIRPWSLSIRGHYAHIHLAVSIYEELLRSLLNEYPNIEPVTMVVHFRQGDLIDSGKQWVNRDSIVRLLSQIKIENNHTSKVFSDSVKSAEEIKISSPEFNWQPMNPGVHIGNILTDCINCQCFVGTTSKISLWAAFFRIIHPRINSETWLPSIVKDEYQRSFGSHNLNAINWYELDKPN